jgi:hypothetical protein
MEKKLYPYTDEELSVFAEKIFKALKPKYKQLIKIIFETEKNNEYVKIWHYMNVILDFRLQKKILSDKYPDLFDNDGWIIEIDKYVEKSIKISDEINRDIRFLLKMLKYESRNESLDPFINISPILDYENKKEDEDKMKSQIKKLN